MAFGKKKASANIDAAVNRAANFEITVADLARKSEKRAWWVAGLSLFLSVCLAGVLAYMQPLKKEVPYLVMVDPYAGIARLTKMEGNSEYEKVTAQETINRANIASFVLARESYDSGALNERDWRTVFTMSEASVLKAYQSERDEHNPDGLPKKYGNATAVRIKILSVTPLGASAGKPPTSAAVRFQRLLFDKSSGATQVLDNRIATMEFKYRPEIRMDREADNMVNPLRFRVTNYRTDADTATAVPVEIPVGKVVNAPTMTSIETPASDAAASAAQGEMAADAAQAASPAGAQAGQPAQPRPTPTPVNPSTSPQGVR